MKLPFWGCVAAGVLLRRQPDTWPWQVAKEPIVDGSVPLDTWGVRRTTTTTPPVAGTTTTTTTMNATQLGAASVQQPPPRSRPTELVELVPDYPQLVEHGSRVWDELAGHAAAAEQAVNAQRNASGLAPVAGWDPRYGWAASEAHPGFKICVHAVVDGEPRFVTVDTAEGAEGVLVQAVTPAETLGTRAVAALSANLSAGETLAETPADAEAFPCTAERAEHLAAQQARRPPAGLGLIAVRSVLPGRRKRPSLLQRDLPAAYDSRAAHPGCALPVVDQGSCGSCYAFAAAAMAGERLCIATGEVSHPLSQQELVSCGSSTQAEYATPWCMKDSTGGSMRTFTSGCHGATSFNALMYLHLFGLPTRDCVPYVSGGEGAGLDHFETGSGGRVPLCSALTQQCRVARAAHRLSVPIPCPPGDVACIQAAIHEGGPVLAGFTVTDEFRQYPPDAEYIYTGSSCEHPETPVGGHAVVLHGWGERNGTRYWLARNSWGDQWGDRGLFKIAFGAMGIEETVLYASADPDERSHLDGACIRVQAVGSQCVLRNSCRTQVRSVQVQYFGSESNCGSWTTTIDEFYPAAEEVVEGFYCTVTRDELVRAVPSERYYADKTSSYPSYGCVLHNTYAGAGTALVCCSGAGTDQCMSSPPGSLAVFPDYACSSEACEQRGGALFEKVKE